MPKKKLIRFADNKTMACIFEPVQESVLAENFKLSGKWNSDYFQNQNPIVIELGCGKGEYTIALAQKYPEKNFIGVDVKGARLWYGAKAATKLNLKNVAFLRSKIELTPNFFSENEVDEIWLTFSDPQPQKPRKRLSSPVFISRYAKFLKAGGTIHLKTDNSMLFEWTLAEIVKNHYTLKGSAWDIDEYNETDDETKDILKVRTHYETMFRLKGFDIKYLKFSI